MYDDAASTLPRSWQERLDAACIGRNDGSRPFRLDEEQPGGLVRHDEVDLEALLIPEVVESARGARRGLPLGDLGRDEGLEDSAHRRRRFERGQRPDPEQVAE